MMTVRLPANWRGALRRSTRDATRASCASRTARAASASRIAPARRGPGRLLAGGLGVLVALSLAACGSTHQGEALALGDQRISEQQLAEAMDQFSGYISPDDGAWLPAPSMVLTLVQGYAFSQALGDQAQFTTSDEVRAELQELRSQYLQQTGSDQPAEPVDFTPSDTVTAFLNAVATLSRVQSRQAAGVDLSTQELTAIQAVAATIEVNPRFGTWDPETLKLGQVGADWLVPAAGPAATAGL